MKWIKIEEGWYQGENNEVVQRWWRAEGSPRDKAGWYLWPDPNGENILGPFKTMKIAISRFE